MIVAVPCRKPPAVLNRVFASWLALDPQPEWAIANDNLKGSEAWALTEDFIKRVDGYRLPVPLRAGAQYNPRSVERRWDVASTWRVGEMSNEALKHCASRKQPCVIVDADTLFLTKDALGVFASRPRGYDVATLVFSTWHNERPAWGRVGLNIYDGVDVRRTSASNYVEYATPPRNRWFGVGAGQGCTLYGSGVLRESRARFRPVPGFACWGEGRHMAIRLGVLGFQHCAYWPDPETVEHLYLPGPSENQEA